ncbi:MAG: ATP synthase subunit I [Deltaproteobacteria bacterium]|nr:ATP synthase subunit I [Deltaproteobacteria bacterium]
MNQIVKDPIQKRIEYISLALWAGLCIISFLTMGSSFAQGVFFGGAICLLNIQWIYRHAKTAVMLEPKRSTFYMTSRYIIRLSVIGFIIFALIAWVKVNIFALLIGLSVVVLGITSYACFSYIFAGGD